jgi:hypothetical protein
MYDPEGMSEKKKSEFERWYQAKVNENYHFVMRTELENYCESDVKLLKSGCQKFRKEFKEHADFDPIEKCVTIASACNRFWRKKMVPLNTIASRPPSGWSGHTPNQSVKAKKWLKWKEHQLQEQRFAEYGIRYNGDQIRSVMNGGEVRINGNLVDGFNASDPVNFLPTVYEFHGCLWHGCPKCFPSKRDAYPIRNADRTLEEIHEYTIKKEEALRSQGFQVISIWECEWDKEVKENEDLKSFLEDFEIVEPLKPREAFYGGRTNAVKLHHVAQGNEKIKYIDVTSLYPWVNKNGKYPVGHPEIIVNPDDQNIEHYFGMAKVDILPPFELYHPVLPQRQKGKLTIPLCGSCVEEEMTKNIHEKSFMCNHTPEERMLRSFVEAPVGLIVKRLHFMEIK